jgi:mono/diheme cytochrome c family protein
MHVSHILAAVIAACAIPAFAGDAAAAGAADAVRKGEELFGRSCQQCHNSRGKGGKGPQLVHGAWGPGGANTDDYMRQIITHGRPGTQMGGFGGVLSPAEVNHIVAFLRHESRQKAKPDPKEDSDDHLW